MRPSRVSDARQPLDLLIDPGVLVPGSTPDRRRQMLIGVQVVNHGSADTAWRWPAGSARGYLDPLVLADSARVAERGALQLLFLTDHPAMREDLATRGPSTSIDPVVVATYLVGATSRIGVALTQSTTFAQPYTIARQLKALDVISGGRMGWNAVTTSDPQIAANFGVPVLDRAQRYERAHEVVQIVQALWGSFPEDALVLDREAGVFADGARIKPINLGGRHVASRGPLPIPASPQGQPVVFQAGGGGEAMQFAGQYASGVYSMAVDVPSGRAHRAGLDAAARAAGREPDEIALFMGVFTTVADTEAAALERRHQLLDMVADTVPGRLRQLSALVGVPVGIDEAHQTLDERQRALLRPAPNAFHSERAVQLLRSGRTPYEALLHGVLDFHTTILGSPEQVADQLEELFEQGAADGFMLIPDVLADGLPSFVDTVVPILQDRGLFHREYEGTTLREHLGVPFQYGRRRG